MFSRAMTRRMRIGSGTALTLAGLPRSPPSTLSRRGRACSRRSASASTSPARSARRAPSRSAWTPIRSRPRSTTATDASIVPRIADPEYVPALAALREEHDVRLVVPLNDLDFPVLARERDRLAPALVLLPDAEASARMSDKLEAHHFFVANGIPSPRSWAPEDVPDDARYPVLVKAREGFGSRNIHRAANADELAFFLALHGCARRSCRRPASARSSRSTSSATWRLAA